MLEMIIIFISVTCIAVILRRWLSGRYYLVEELGGPPGWPILGHVPLFLRKEFLTALLELDRTYSGVARFWLGHKLVVGVNDPRLCEGEYYYFMRPLFGDGLIAADAHKWLVSRKIVAPMLNAVKVASFVPTFLEGSAALVLAWKSKIGVSFEPYEDVSRTAFGFTLRTALGKNYDISEGKLKEMVALVNRISEGIAYRFIRPWLYPQFLFDFTSVGKQVNHDSTKFRELLQELTELENQDKDSFINHIMSSASHGGVFMKKAALDELSTYMTAGFETTSTAIIFTLVMLGCHPLLQEKIFLELDDISKRNCKISFDALCQMKYLDRFIKETMRLFPVITVIGRNLKADIVVGNKTLPKGAFVSIPVYAIQRNAEFWEHPEVFDPDRFLTEREKEQHDLHFMPFGGGPRVCLGQKYALVSMKVMIACIIREFKITTGYRMEDIRISKSVTLNTSGLTIKLHQRKKLVSRDTE